MVRLNLGNELVHFLPQIDDGKTPFMLGRAGISYTNKDYIIEIDNPGELCYQYVISGEGVLEIENKKYILKAGDVFFLPPRKAHKYYSNPKKPWIKIFFCFNGGLAKKILGEYRVENIIKTENIDIYQEFIKMFNIAGSYKKNGKNATNFEAALVLMKVAQRIAEKSEVFEKKGNDAYKLKEFIERNLCANISLQDMADFLNLSRSQTIRVFRGEFGISPYEYFMDKKMDYAAEVLKNSAKSIGETAFDFGFNDENYFSRVFRKKFGISPGRYRKIKAKRW